MADRKPCDVQIEEYRGNILIDACGPILSPRELTTGLTVVPPLPARLRGVESHIRRHQVGSVQSLHIPTAEEIRLANSLHVMIRRGYVHRHPSEPKTWSGIYDSVKERRSRIVSPYVALGSGISGAGKTSATEHILSMIPAVCRHNRFPAMASPFDQLVWLKINAPATGSSIELARILMGAFDEALKTERFRKRMLKNGSGHVFLREWEQAAKHHFLGLLVIDEAQNFFKMQTRAERMRKADRDRLELRIVEDETLKFILTLSNTAGIPVLLLATPDGSRALSKRFSTLQRMGSGGSHTFLRSVRSDEQYFSEYLFPSLAKYQWFEKKLQATDELRDLLHKLSGGVPRIYMGLWEHAHSCAFDRNGDSLRLADFENAMTIYMSDLRPAIAALVSDDVRGMSEYEDLLPGRGRTI